MKNPEIVERLFQCLANGNMGAAGDLMDENIIWNQMKGFPSGGQYCGRELVFEKVFASFSKHWTGWSAAVNRYVDCNDTVFAIGCYEGTYRATGSFVVADFCSIFILRDGRVVYFQQYADTFLIARAMGMTNRGIDK